MGIILFQILYIITTTPDKEMIYTCSCIKREFFIQASKPLMIFLRQLRISPARPISSKLL
jgi:hypothetical protein